MILLAKIIGFVLILVGVVSVVAVIPTYRAFKSEETRFFLTPNNSKPPTESDEAGSHESPVPIDDVQFLKTFILPPVLTLILGMAVVAVAFRRGTPGGDQS